MVKMESSFNKSIVILLVTMLVFMEGSRALSFCMTEDALNECKPAVVKPNPSAPTELCCKYLSSADLQCLCGYKTSPVMGLLGIDPDLAMGLAAKCGLTPPANC